MLEPHYKLSSEQSAVLVRVPTFYGILDGQSDELEGGLLDG